uniref:Uncharacterized protein n=1 Tax=Panagrolaimus davidi TaxID=227884 RepID=A0A914PP58_9BILA
MPSSLPLTTEITVTSVGEDEELSTTAVVIPIALTTDMVKTKQEQTSQTANENKVMSTTLIAENNDVTTIIPMTVTSSEATTDAIKTGSENVVKITEIPIASTPGIIAAIIAHGSTVVPVSEATQFVTDTAPEATNSIESEEVTTTEAQTISANLPKQTVVSIIINNEEKEEQHASTIVNVDATTIISETIEPSESTTAAAPISIAPLVNSQSIAPVAPLGDGQIVEDGSTTVEPVDKTTILLVESSSKSENVTKIPLTTVETKDAPVVPVIISNEENKIEPTTEIPQTTVITVEQTTPANAENIDATTILDKTVITPGDTTTTAAPVSIGEGQIVVGGSSTAEPRYETTVVLPESLQESIKKVSLTTFETKEATILPVMVAAEEKILKTTTETPENIVMTVEQTTPFNAENIDVTTIIPETESTTVSGPISIAPLEISQSIAPIAPLGEGQIVEGGITTSEPILESTIVETAKSTEIPVNSQTGVTSVVLVVLSSEQPATTLDKNDEQKEAKTVVAITTVLPLESSSAAFNLDENVPVVMVNNQNAAQSTSAPLEGDGVNPNAETSPAIIASAVTTLPSEINIKTVSTTKSVEVEEATNANENVAITEIPVVTSTGIIAGIIAHGSTVEPVTVKEVIETNIATTISPEASTPEIQTSTTKAEILPVIIESKEKTAEPTTSVPQTTKLQQLKRLPFQICNK